MVMVNWQLRILLVKPILNIQQPRKIRNCRSVITSTAVFHTQGCTSITIMYCIYIWTVIRNNNYGCLQRSTLCITPVILSVFIGWWVHPNSKSGILP